jgi:hypothetical protein
MASSFRKKESRILALSKLYKWKGNHQRIFDYRQLINLIIMGQILERIIEESINKKQTPDEIESLDNEQTPDEVRQSPSQLKRYLVGPSLSMEFLNNWEGRYPGAFEHIPKEVFLLMVDYLNDSNRRELGQVCRPFFFVIIKLQGPQIQGSLAFWLPTEIEDSRKQDSYRLCMEFHKTRATYEDNTSMGPVCYFGGIMNQSPPQFCEENPFQFFEEDLLQFCEENPPQWNIVTLEGETNDHIINQSWVNYLGECINLHFLKLVNVNNIDLNNIGKLTKLGVLFMKFKPVGRLYASIIPPSSVKTIVVSISEESDQESDIQFSKRCMDGSLYLETQEGTRLDIW